jgi:pyruvate formate lyase activating enzyme
LKNGAGGLCRVRFNSGGFGSLPYYGFISALALDPIEKKPLYHFRPGTQILSAGFAGCNLRCPFCQNWHISQNTDIPGRYISPRELIAAAKKEAVGQIAYTYSEPLVHIEYLLDCMKEGRKQGVANVLVSNGCVTKDAAAVILEYTDAANIDLKCFSGETYSKILGGDLEAVKSFIAAAHERGVHLELTTLVVPGLNDSPEELDASAGFISGISPGIPWHLSAYHPDWKWNAPPTRADFLLEAAKLAGQKLRYVYTGNIGVARRLQDRRT